MTAVRDQYPAYDELETFADTGERHAWGVFGADDEIGCVNFLTEDLVTQAAKEIQQGRVVNLDLPVGEPKDPFWSSRSAPARTEEVTRTSRDDRLDNFYLQGSSQWDALRHHRYRQHGYYGARQDSDVDDRKLLGIDRWATRGIIGRGILLDVDGYMTAQNRAMPPTERFLIDSELMEAVAAAQGTDLRPGDILLVRTGWLAWYQQLTQAQRKSRAAEFKADRRALKLPGIDPRVPTVAWIWDHRIAAMATDTPTFDALEFRREDGWAHQRLLALLGMAIGELWDLEQLAVTCADLRRYSFFLTSSPLNLPEGAGSPPNAYAIF
jgi:kynurenine formamidase